MAAVVVCTECGTQARSVSHTRGSLLIEIVLWLCFLVPGLLYSLWRLSTRRNVCAACGSPRIVPPGSPVGRRLVQEGPQARGAASPAPSPAPGGGSWTYELGRAVGEMPSWMRLVFLGLFAVGAVVWSAAMNTETAPPAAPPRAAATDPAAAEKARQAAELAEKVRVAERKLMCARDEASLLAAARADLRKGDADGAAARLAPCEGDAGGGRFDALIATARSAAEVNLRKQQARIAAEEKARKRREGVHIGMNKQDVLDSNWGRPRTVNRTINAFGTHEQWVYDGGYLYFDGDVLTSIQN